MFRANQLPATTQAYKDYRADITYCNPYPKDTKEHTAYRNEFYGLMDKEATRIREQLMYGSSY